jgi:peptidoglycan/LPS O-acetylase OafA/YrhL
VESGSAEQSEAVRAISDGSGAEPANRSTGRRDGEARISIVDLVRFASITLVLTLHVANAPLALHRAPLLVPLWEPLVRNGLLGVSLFFVVSGYVITRSIVAREPDLRKLDLRGFYVRRAGRILPSVLLAVTVGALCLAVVPVGKLRVPYCLHHPGVDYDLAFWLSLFTFSFNWLRIVRRETVPAYGLHWDIFWSLAVEEQFYLVYPVALRTLGTRKAVVRALLVVIALGPVARVISSVIDPGFLVTFTNSFVCFDLLAWGALLFFALERLPPPPSRGRRWAEGATGLGALGALLTIFAATDVANPVDRIWVGSALGASLAVFMGAGIRLDWGSSRVMRALVFPGQLSYGAYLFHPLVLWAAWRLLRGRALELSLPLYALMTMVLAFLLYRLFEQPLNRRIRRRFSAGASWAARR